MTENELIDALGGPLALGRLLGVSGPAVSNWKARGEIPAKHHWPLYRICLARQIKWKPEEPDAAKPKGRSAA